LACAHAFERDWGEERTTTKAGHHTTIIKKAAALAAALRLTLFKVHTDLPKQGRGKETYHCTNDAHDDGMCKILPTDISKNA
jgi:hypothetical protein